MVVLLSKFLLIWWSWLSCGKAIVLISSIHRVGREDKRRGGRGKGNKKVGKGGNSFNEDGVAEAGVERGSGVVYK